MKENYIKILFFTTVILCVGIGIYSILKNKTTLAIDTEKIKSVVNIYDNLNIGISKLDTMNPFFSKNQDMQYVFKLIYNSLIEISEDFCLEQGLASEWSKIDNKTYLIKLKEDVYWHDGTIFNANDVKYTINVLKETDVDSIYKDSVENIDKLEIIDEFTIKIILNEEVPFFEYFLCFPIIKETENIGTGEYRIKQIKENKIVLEKADNKSDTKFKNIYIKIYEDTAQLYTALIKEEIDIITTNNINFKDYIGEIGFKEEIICGREFDYIKINLKNEILKNKEVRQAISYAINKKKIIYNVYNNYYIASDFPLSYGSYLYENEVKNTYNANKAKQVLKENGWNVKNEIWNKNGIELKLELITNSNNEKRLQVAEKIKEQLKEIGILVEIKKVSNFEYENALKNKNYELILTGNIVPISPNVNSYFENEKNVLELSNIENKEVLKNKYKELISENNEQNIIIGLYFNSTIIIYNSKINGNFSGNWYNIFYNIDTWYKTDLK